MNRINTSLLLLSVRLGWSASNAADAVASEAAMAIEGRVAPELGLGESLSAADYQMAQDAGKVAKSTEVVAQTEVLRDIVGNPFRQVAVDAPWLTWNNRTVVLLAQTIYDQQAFGHLPILADALEDAGCTNTDFLNHCRLPGEQGRRLVMIPLGNGGFRDALCSTVKLHSSRWQAAWL